jgi:hypothetical protein
MTVPRIRIGDRANGDIGVFISPTGVDATTASDSQLVMGISTKISNLILLGHVSSSALVPLGLHSRPFIFLTSQYSFSGVIGHTAGPGPMRPSPPVSGGSSASALINSSGASMSITASTSVYYIVYSATY